MNPTAIRLAQDRFQASLNVGTSIIPVSLSQLFTKPNTGFELQNFDTETIGHSMDEEFQFLRNIIASGEIPDTETITVWESAIRWLLSALRDWDSSEVNSINKLRALLGAVTAVDVNLAGLSSVASQIASSQLIAGLQGLIENTDANPDFNERWGLKFHQQIESLANGGNLEHLMYMIPHLIIYPMQDFWVAVKFMYNADPDALASIIERRNNVLFSLMICTILETQSIELASRVNNLMFKFISVANIWQGRSAHPLQISENILQILLLQVANTSNADWASWMQALFKFPGNNTPLNSALARILEELSQEHWEAFFKAISLNYSHRAAEPVANILTPFTNSNDTERKTLMFAIAYKVWSNWSYGQYESEIAMFAPASCALDFPVAMYYASLPNDECLAEKNDLLEAIETIEEKRFNSVTDLITERNRLKSRLRLVQHGIDLAIGSTQALPPNIQPDSDLYTNTRYYYQNVNII